MAEAKTKHKTEYLLPESHNDQTNQVHQTKPKLAPTKLLYSFFFFFWLLYMIYLDN